MVVFAETPYENLCKRMQQTSCHGFQNTDEFEFSQHLSWISFFICFFLWFSIPPLLPTIQKPACLQATHPVCINCVNEFKELGIPSEMGLDPTCRLCDPYNDAENGGCGGIGPNYVEKWTVNGTLSMKAAGFDAVLIGLSSSDISMANMAGVLGAIIIRLIIGPISDQIGLRLSYSSLLLVAALPGFGLCGPSTVAICLTAAIPFCSFTTNANQTQRSPPTEPQTRALLQRPIRRRLPRMSMPCRFTRKA